MALESEVPKKIKKNILRRESETDGKARNRLLPKISLK